MAVSTSATVRLGRLAVAAIACVAVVAEAGRGGQPQAQGTVDLTGSRVYAFVGRKGLGHDHAIAGLLHAGDLRLGASERAGTLVFDMRSFRADEAAARKVVGLAGETDASTRRQVDDNMLGAAVLDVANHPTATFDIRTALPSQQQPGNGKTAYDLVGAFTLHGVTRPLAVRAEAENVGPVVRLWGGFSIRQTDFGMKPFSKLGGVVGVADELRIFGDIRILAGANP